MPVVNKSLDDYNTILCASDLHHGGNSVVSMIYSRRNCSDHGTAHGHGRHMC